MAALLFPFADIEELFGAFDSFVEASMLTLTT